MRLSTRPGRTNAASNKSARFVAPIKKIPLVFLKPSNATNNSFKVLSRSLVESSPSVERFLPTASISSIKIIQGIFSFANLKSSRIRLEPTPTYFS